MRLPSLPIVRPVLIIMALSLASCTSMRQSGKKPQAPAVIVRMHSGSTVRMPAGFVSEEPSSGPIVFGTIRDGRSNSPFKIEYRLYSFTGYDFSPGDIETLKRNGHTILKHSRGTANGTKYDLVIARDAEGNKKIYVSYAVDDTVFYAQIASSKELDLFKQIVFTFQVHK